MKRKNDKKYNYFMAILMAIIYIYFYYSDFVISIKVLKINIKKISFLNFVYLINIICSIKLNIIFNKININSLNK